MQEILRAMKKIRFAGHPASCCKARNYRQLRDQFMTRTVITSTGSYLPDKIVPNESLCQFSPEAQILIAQKTGVRARRHGEDSECTSDLAVRAARRCMDGSGVPLEDVEGIILSTS
jgi:3-oxoacyl-[acyl-carrier-protein] synthase-3